jgi:aryl-alcohol dehydrogenase-like predicted oxidoreductase
MSGSHNHPDRAESIATIHAAMDQGITYLNTGDFYGAGHSEMLVGEALRSRKREDAFISVKFGALIGPDGRPYGIDVRPQAVKNYLAYSLQRLGTDYIDLYQPGRIAPHIPVEETIGAIADMVRAGYVKTIGVSEVDAATLRKANAVHPISFVEMGYSLLNRSIEKELLPTARELGIGIVAFGVLSMGLFGGNWTKETISDGNILRMMPRFSGENFDRNIAFVETLRNIAAEKGITVSQLAIAWVMAQGDDILTLVGSRRVAQINDTVKALGVELTAVDLARIEKDIPEQTVASFMPEMKFNKDGLIESDFTPEFHQQQGV